MPDVKGRQETLSPTPQVPQTVRSAIELNVKDFEPSEQRIIDKCGEVDLQLSNHRDWQQPNSQLRQDICDLLLLLKTRNFCIILCNVKVSIYICTMCGNKDINRRIIATLNRTMCGNICVLFSFS